MIKIITIDNENTEFYDDALSIHAINEKTITVFVFITNVPGWLEHMDLWRHIYNMKTVYLQNKRHLMLPYEFIKMCSLRFGDRYRYAFRPPFHYGSNL